MENQIHTPVELLGRLKKDDRAAFEAIYHIHFKDVYRYICDRVDTIEQCEELVTDLFIELWHNRMSIEDVDQYMQSATKHCLFQFVRDHPESQLYGKVMERFREMEANGVLL